MKLLTVCVIATIFGTMAVHGLQCYLCTSATSMDDCSSQEVASTCPGDLSNAVCTKAEIHYKGLGDTMHNFYSKGCSTKDVCNGTVTPACKEQGVVCKADCCSADSCNGGGQGGSSEVLSCYQCASTTSMDDCTKKQKSVHCPSASNRCGMIEAHSSQRMFFAKGCINEETCRTFCAGGSNKESGMECELSCCAKDMCN